MINEPLYEVAIMRIIHRGSELPVQFSIPSTGFLEVLDYKLQQNGEPFLAFL